MYVSLLLLNFGIELFSDYMVIKGIIRQQVMCEASHDAGTLISTVKDYWIGSLLKEETVPKPAD